MCNVIACMRCHPRPLSRAASKCVGRGRARHERRGSRDSEGRHGQRCRHPCERSAHERRRSLIGRQSEAEARQPRHSTRRGQPSGSVRWSCQVQCCHCSMLPRGAQSEQILSLKPPELLNSRRDCEPNKKVMHGRHTQPCAGSICG